MKALLVFLAAFAAAEGYWIASGGADNRRPFAEEPRIARHLALGHGFRSPMSSAADAPPTGWSPPLYPLLMAGAYKIYGEDSKATLWVLGAFNCLAFALVVTCAFTLMKAAGGAAILTAVLFCLNPMLRDFVGDYWDALAGLALYFIALVLAARGGLRTRGGALLGALLGVLSLTAASYALSYPLLVLKAGRRLVAASVLAFVLVLLPWTLRLHQVFGGARYVRTGPQVELWIGNQPGTNGWLSNSMLALHPYRSGAERKLLLEMGEPAYFARAGQLFEREVTAGSFLRRSVQRFVFLFLSDPAEPTAIPLFTHKGPHAGRTLLNALVAGLGLAGFALAARLRFKLGWLLPASLLAVAPYFITSASDRYALPLRATLTMGVAFLLWAVARRLLDKAWPASNL